jgi:hypothetical protein
LSHDVEHMLFFLQSHNVVYSQQIRDHHHVKLIQKIILKKRVSMRYIQHFAYTHNRVNGAVNMDVVVYIVSLNFITRFKSIGCILLPHAYL